MISEEELHSLVQAVSNNDLSKNYDIETIVERILPQYMIPKSDVLNIYFDDIVNYLDANEDIIKYIEKLRKEWE